MRRRDLLAGIAGTAGAVGIYGAAGALTRDAGRPASNSTEGEPSGSGPTGSGSYEPLGSVDLAGTRELVTGEDGDTAYLAVDDGIATVDVSTPSEPAVLAERRDLLAGDPDGPLELCWDVSVDGDRLLAAGPANRIPGSDLHAALLFDVADPAAPRLLDAFRTSYPIHNCFLGDGTAYLTANGLDGNPLVLLDAGDDAISEAGRWSLFDVEPAWAAVNTALRQLHDVVVQDGVAYLPYWEAGTYLVDVSDPAAPSYLGHTSVRDRAELTNYDAIEAAIEQFTPPGNSHFATPDASGDLLAVGREAWATPAGDCVRGGPAGVDLYDVSDPTAIEHRSTIDPPGSYDDTQQGWFTTAHNVDLHDGRLYSSWYFGGVKLHDVRDPADPVELSWWRDPTSTAFWTAQHAAGGDYFVASSADDAAGYADGIPGRVYVFPDRAGRQPDPPDLTEPPNGASSVPDC